MATYGLPTRGQADWDDELNNSVEALRGDVDAAKADATVAKATAVSAVSAAAAAEHLAEQAAESAAVSAAAATQPTESLVATILEDESSEARAAVDAAAEAKASELVTPVATDLATVEGTVGEHAAELTGRLSGDALTATYGRGVSVKDPQFGATGDGSTDDTDAIQAAIDSGAGTVFLPAGEYRVSSLSIPAYVNVTGPFSRAYTTTPSGGARLVCNNPAQTDPVVTMANRSRLTGVAVAGAGGGPVIELTSNGGIIRDVAVTGGVVGVSCNYHLAHLDNVAIYSNSGDGVHNLLDGSVRGCTINANGGNGINLQTGAGSCVISDNRIEWNDRHGIYCYQPATLSIVGNFIDRNGKTGIALTLVTDASITGNTIRRNGRLSSGAIADDANLRMESCTGVTVSANTTATGEDDGGGGYMSPSVALRTQSLTECVIVGNILTGGTAASVSTITPSTDSKRFGNMLRMGESETYLGASYMQSATATAATTETKAVVIPGVAVTNYSPGYLYEVLLSARASSTGGDSAATCKLLVQREGGAASVAVVGLENHQGTAFATSAGTYNVTASVNTDGSSVTLNLENTSGGTVAFRALVR